MLGRPAAGRDASPVDGLPAGTVTFVFTDVEGSTQLLDEVGDTVYGELLAEHHRVCREAWAAHGGVEVTTAGDAFVVAFERPRDALAAALAAQEGLAATRFRVRMGVHTGEVTLNETGYVGLELHRAARIAAAAHGGQVLVSSATAALTGTDGLVDLGEHRFYHLAAPERAYQLGEGEFPPIKSLYRSHLPVPATAFIGRERELGELVELLAGPSALVTLTGPGGTGKTRLALQAASESWRAFPDGVFWVPLAPLRDPELVSSSLARVLHVPEESGRELVEALAERVVGMRALVLLDNAEHLLPGAAQTVARLVSADGPTVLVTSRERLQLAGERVFSVPELDQRDAVQLFLERALAVGTRLEPSPVLAELCDRLERLPLALELAAARSVVFPPEQLLARLSQRLDLLKGGRDADPRQQSLRATTEWSYQLLDADEQRLLRALSVFAGGCTYEAAETVFGADDETVQSLIDKSLLRRRDTDRGPRYSMLETIRELVSEKLEAAGEQQDVRRRHLLWVSEATSSGGSALVWAREAEWYEVFSSELANVRAALAFAEAEGDGDTMARLAARLCIFAYIRGGLAEARDALEIALALEPSPAARLDALRSLTNAADRLGDNERARELAVEQVALARRLGDDPALVFALRDLGNTYLNLLDERAVDAYEESRVIASAIGDLAGQVGALVNLGAFALATGRWSDALQLTREAAALNEALHDRETAANLLYNEAVAIWQLGLPDDPRRLLEEALTLGVELGWLEGVRFQLEALAALDLEGDEADRGTVLLGVGRRLRRDSNVGDYDPLHTGLVAAAHRRSEAALGAALSASRLEQGAELDLQTAVALALGDVSLGELDRAGSEPLPS
jgi:predicted ATPase/class 3 adenylate cyclase